MHISQRLMLTYNIFLNAESTTILTFSQILLHNIFVTVEQFFFSDTEYTDIQIPNMQHFSLLLRKDFSQILNIQHFVTVAQHFYRIYRYLAYRYCTYFLKNQATRFSQILNIQHFVTNAPNNSQILNLYVYRKISFGY